MWQLSLAEEIGPFPLPCFLAQIRHNQLPDATAKQKEPSSNSAPEGRNYLNYLMWWKPSSKELAEADDNVAEIRWEESLDQPVLIPENSKIITIPTFQSDNKSKYISGVFPG